MTILEKIKFEEDWLSEVNLTKENIKIAFAGIRVTALEQQPCEDCISRENLLNSIEEPMNWTDSEAEIQEQKDYENFVALVKSMPPVTPQPKLGHWIAGVDRWGDIVTTVNGYRCSECCAFNADKDNYCPNCGAKMEVEE